MKAATNSFEAQLLNARIAALLRAGDALAKQAPDTPAGRRAALVWNSTKVGDRRADRK